MAVDQQRASADQLADEFTARRFRLAALPAPLRPAAIGVLVVIGAWSAVIALNAAGLGVKPDSLSDTGFGLMAAPGWGPPLVRLGTVVALAVTAVAAVTAAFHPGWPAGRAARVLRRGILAAVTAAGFALATRPSIDAMGLIDLLSRPDAPTGTLRWLIGFRIVAAQALVWAGLTSALALPFVRLSGIWSRRAALVLAVAPFATFLLATAIVGDLGAAWMANADWRNDRLLNFVEGLELLLGLYLAWELTTWTGFVSDISAYVARRRAVGAAVVTGLLAVKLVWLALGFAGLLPAVAGGGADVWKRTAGDGIGSWLTAAILAGVLFIWLVRPRTLARRRAAVAGGSALLLVALLCLPGLAAGTILALYRSVRDLFPAGPLDVALLVLLVLAVATLAGGLAVADRAIEHRGRQALPAVARTALITAGVLGLLLAIAVPADVVQLRNEVEALATATTASPQESVGFNLEVLAGAVAAHYFVAPGLAFGAALIMTLVAARRRRAAPTAAAFALALAGLALLYTLPRLGQVPLQLDVQGLGASGDYLAPRLAHNIFPLAAPWWERWWNGPAGGFELATLDTVVSVGLCGLALWCWHQGRRDWPPIVAFVLLTSTVLAHSATLAPTNWIGTKWFYLALLFPVVAQFLYRGGELNEAAARRPELALLSLAAVALLLTLLGYRLFVGSLDPTVDLDNQLFVYTRGFTTELILLPLGFAAVALRLQRSPHPRSEPHPPSNGPAPEQLDRTHTLHDRAAVSRQDPPQRRPP